MKEESIKLLKSIKTKVKFLEKDINKLENLEEERI